MSEGRYSMVSAMCWHNISMALSGNLSAGCSWNSAMEPVCGGGGWRTRYSRCHFVGYSSKNMLTFIKACKKERLHACYPVTVMRRGRLRTVSSL